MSSTVLFGAEVDKIQDALFRAARQRQVVGGSRLLVEFENAAQELARKHNADAVLVNAGGNFRILFPSELDAKSFGRELANAYHLLLDASITIADPITLANGFESANLAISDGIRRLKRAKSGGIDSPHAPSTAFCQASGVGLAATRDFDYRAPKRNPVESDKRAPKRNSVESDKKYLAQFAARMGDAGNKESDAQDSFYKPIRACLGQPYHTREWADDVDPIARFDGERKNVAYLVADGNSMGELFGICDEKQIVELSRELENAMRRATTAPIPLLADRLGENTILPALPLILAGDDAFVLLPAKYALDVAQQFCLAFEKALRDSAIVNQLRDKARARDKDLAPPTMAAAIVICKAHYPYHLAHQRGEELLKRAKRLVKTMGVEKQDESWRSALAFDMIVGSELVSAGNESAAEFRTSPGIYWATRARDAENLASVEHPLTAKAELAALSIERLLEQCYEIKDLPAKRLEQARELFTPEALPRDVDEMRQAWNPRLKKLLDRIAATALTKRNGKIESKMLADFQNGIRALGDPADVPDNPGHWRVIVRKGQREFHAHGLPDLIKTWDYAQSLAHKLAEYKAEETR